MTSLGQGWCKKGWTKRVKFVTWEYFWTINSIMMFISQKNNFFNPIHDVIVG